MKFKQLSILALTFVFINILAINPLANEANLQVNAKSAVLMDAATGRILIEQNAHEKLPPASVTKVMTLLLIYEAVASGKIGWEDKVTISEHAAKMGGSQVFLEPNEVQDVATLTKCIAIASANDAAVAMAEFIGGSEENFANMMNERAKQLGMNNTHFVNACGLDAEGHLTTAYDIAVMSRELINNHPDVFEYLKTWQDTMIHKTRRGETEFGLTNTNKLLKWYPDATGLKTGSTEKALYCLSGTAERNGLSLVGVVMAAPDFKTRFTETIKMFDYGFANFELAHGHEPNTTVGAVRVHKGAVTEIDVLVKDSVSSLVEKGRAGELSHEIQIDGAISAPFEAGAKVGEIIYSFNGEEVGRSDLVTSEAVDKISLGGMLGKVLENWF